MCGEFWGLKKTRERECSGSTVARCATLLEWQGTSLLSSSFTGEPQLQFVGFRERDCPCPVTVK